MTTLLKHCLKHGVQLNPSHGWFIPTGWLSTIDHSKKLGLLKNQESIWVSDSIDLPSGAVHLGPSRNWWLLRHSELSWPDWDFCLVMKGAKQRMFNACSKVWWMGYPKKLIMGSPCFPTQRILLGVPFVDRQILQPARDVRTLETTWELPPLGARASGQKEPLCVDRKNANLMLSKTQSCSWFGVRSRCKAPGCSTVPPHMDAEKHLKFLLEAWLLNRQIFEAACGHTMP